jgi:hypothetical protein
MLSPQQMVEEPMVMYGKVMKVPLHHVAHEKR